MEFLNFLREEPMMAGLVFVGLLITIVPMTSVLWRKMSGRNPVDVAKQSVHATKPVRFGNQTELLVVLVGLLMLLAVISWICGIFRI